MVESRRPESCSIQDKDIWTLSIRICFLCRSTMVHLLRWSDLPLLNPGPTLQDAGQRKCDQEAGEIDKKSGQRSRSRNGITPTTHKSQNLMSTLLQAVQHSRDM